MRIKVDTSGILRMQAAISDMGKQVRFAEERALNKAAFEAKLATENEIRRVFDRPTSWMQRSVRYTKASRKTQTILESTVDFDFWGNKQGVTASQVLNAEIHGGVRRLKRFEVALQRAGVLPPGMAAVPGKRVKLDDYGNVPSALIVQILSYFQAFGEQGYRANATAKTRARKWKGTKTTGGFEYFVLQYHQGKLIPGIYMRKNYSADQRDKVSHLQRDGAFLIFAFVPVPKYRRRLDFYGLAERTALDTYAKVFPDYLKQAMRTAR